MPHLLCYPHRIFACREHHARVGVAGLEAEVHTHLFDFLRLLRNTIHNNGVYYPVNRKDAAFAIQGRDYILECGKRVDVFGWEYFIEWLDPIREALADVTSAPAVVAPDQISDIASQE